MTLQQIRYMITIAETGSLGKAAEKLFVSQPSLSGAVKEMETELGLTLFHRGSKGVTLTPEGQRFLPYARQVEDQYLNLMESFGKIEKRKTHFAVSTQHYSFAVKAFVETARAYDVAEYEFAIRETRTRQVIDDVVSARSEIGVLYLSDFNRRVLERMIQDGGLQFHHLIGCRAYAYLWKGHPLAGKKEVTFEDLAPWPNMSFEQGENSSFYLAEEIFSDVDYPRVIRCCDRATMLNLMVGLGGYTLCSGIICEELNGSDYIAVPYRTDREGGDAVMEIGYVTRANTLPSGVGARYIQELKRYLDAEGAAR